MSWGLFVYFTQFFNQTYSWYWKNGNWRNEKRLNDGGREKGAYWNAKIVREVERSNWKDIENEENEII